MGILAQISIFEVITVLVILFVSFYLIFKPIQVTSSKEISNLFLISRDFLKTIDNLNLHYFIFTNVSKFDEFYINTLKNQTYIGFFSTDNLIKERIIIAANCSEKKIEKLYNWFGKVKFNKREVSIFFVPANLSSLPQHSDLLIICDYINLTEYKSELISYLSKGKGIIGFFDISETVDKVI
ncbi:MAG: hypothetical protein QXD89_01950, partial [Candidatus Aenigmatarchaeota archaeon]